jgi:hypothetical protein
MKKEYHGPERRKFIRLDYMTPLGFKVCNPDTITKLMQGYTVDVSEGGILCRLPITVHKNDILWLSFDRATLSVCQEIEKNCFIYQNGIVGKVVRVEDKSDGTCHIGVQFIVREEPNLTHIYPKFFFSKGQDEQAPEDVSNGSDEENSIEGT